MRKANAGAGQELHNTAPRGLAAQDARHGVVMIVQVLDFQGLNIA
jgi:hypothetical protein